MMSSYDEFCPPSSEEFVRKLREDALAKNQCGCFKLYDKGTGTGRGERRLVAVFGTRGPCEDFLTLVEHDKRYYYEFSPFTTDASQIKGKWVVEVDDEGDGVRSAYWQEGLVANPMSNYRHGENRVRGEGRTKAEAIANARRYREELRVWERDEKPKRPKGCYCQPRHEQRCGVCEREVVEHMKKVCGCPHCKGDHQIVTRASDTR